MTVEGVRNVGVGKGGRKPLQLNSSLCSGKGIARRIRYLDVIEEVYNLGYADAETKKSHRLDGKFRQVN